LIEKEMPETTFSFRFLAGLMDHPTLARHVAFLGNLHCGKTSVVDIFVQQTHIKEWDFSVQTRYTDIRVDEQERGVSVKAMPMSMVLPSLSGKSYLLNILDTPGHVNFCDEQTAALRLADGAVIVVDAAEGCMAQTEASIKAAMMANLPVSLIINKMDRLILELKLPPSDAYHKLCHVLQEVNEVLAKYGDQRVSPLKGNVCFACSAHGWIFTLESFAKIYSDYHGTFKVWIPSPSCNL
jgi:U5 small nuclear ribonucleoprotein component